MSLGIADGRQGLSRRSTRAGRSLSCSMARQFRSLFFAKGSEFRRKRCARGLSGAGTITCWRSDRSELRLRTPSNAFGAQHGVRFRAEEVAA